MLLDLDGKEVVADIRMPSMMENDVGPDPRAMTELLGIRSMTLSVVFTVHIPARQLPLEVDGQTMSQ